MASTEIAAGATEFHDRALSYERASGGSTSSVALHLASLCGPISKDAYILDCAAGPGTVVDALLESADTGPGAREARYAIVEPAPGMLSIVEHKIATEWAIPRGNVTTHLTAAEDLQGTDMPPGALTHAFSNFGFMFFSDPVAAASAICRLLQPGGRAFITTFALVGYLLAMADACAQIRPGREVLKLPTSDAWFDASHLESVLRAAGFAEVTTHVFPTEMVHASLHTAAASISNRFAAIARAQGWTDDELGALPAALEAALLRDTSNVRIHGDVHIQMHANVAVCSR